MEVEVLKERDTEIEKLLKITDIIIGETSIVTKTKIATSLEVGAIDLDLSDDIAGFLMTIFTCLRKEENDKSGHDKYLAYKTTIEKTEISVGTVVNKIKAANIKIDFRVATPIVELMTLFKAFYDEVRTGVTKFKVRADFMRKTERGPDGKMKWAEQTGDRTHNITMYGLNNHHIPLLQGITLAPERRTGVLRSLGPMAQAIIMVMENRYHTKLTNSLKYSLQMIPMCNEIVQCLKEASSPGSVAGILKELGDILLLTTARSTQKVYFPLLAVKYMWGKKGGTQWSFSGAPVIKLYNKLVIEGMRFAIKSGADSALTGEIIFHAMFGTYLDDLHILTQITDRGRWHHRKDLNAVFTRRGEKTQVTLRPIIFTKISKMAQALQTRTLGNVDPCATSRPSFTGFRKRNLTQEFTSYLTTGRSALNYSSDPIQLVFALKKLKDMIILDKDDKVLRSGTKNWEQKRVQSGLKTKILLP